MTRSASRTNRCLRLSASTAFALVFLASLPAALRAQVPVPGTGQRVAKVGDDFEDEKWTYTFNLPKSSDENDKQQRLPAGRSVNGRWYEGVMRGQPDVIRRVTPPEGGIPGSQGALLMRSNQTGVPGSFGGKFEQDDLILDVPSRIGGAISVSQTPSVVTRVYFPAFEHWERRTGPSFGFRAACQAYKTSKKKGRFGGGGTTTKLETYWPGFFVQFAPGDGKSKPDSASFSLRAGPTGHDFPGPQIKEAGWWTLGMSFSSDGNVHYFAHPGVEDLTAADHISSQSAYSLRCEQLDTLFFNVVSGNNGQWSTPWIVDDPAVYTGSRYQRKPLDTASARPGAAAAK